MSFSTVEYTAKPPVDAADCEKQPDIENGIVIVDSASQPTDKPFNIWSCLGLQYSLTSTPLAVGSYLSSIIGVGGSPAFIYGFIFSVACNLCICASLAEIAAVLPHTAGQIFWTASFAPRARARGLAYLCTWVSCAAYLFLTAATVLLGLQLLWALVEAVRSTFVAQPWHYYVVYIGGMVLALVFDIPLFRLYPYLLKSMVVYINAGALFILIVLLARTHPKQTASFVFVDFVNQTDWKSNGVVFFIGLLPGVSSVNGFDSVAHLADEVPEPKKNIPRVMMGSALLSTLAGIPMILVMMFCTTNPDNLLAPIGNQPVAQLLLDSLDSEALTIIGILVYTICMFAASICTLTAFSRVLWSTSRLGCFPFSGFMATINTHYDLPVNAIFVGFFLVVALGAIQLGSSTAINAILGGGIVLLYTSYEIVLLTLAWKGRSNVFPKERHFNTGRFGAVFNIISVVWIPFIVTWLCFPSYLPVTKDTMNYASVVLVGIFVCATVNWFAYSRKRHVLDFNLVE